MLPVTEKRIWWIVDDQREDTEAFAASLQDSTALPAYSWEHLDPRTAIKFLLEAIRTQLLAYWPT
jgi:hypothetical protein